MRIKVISIKSDNDEHPTVNFVGPDPEMDAFKLLPKGKVLEMTLLHYGQQHYNLIVSKDSELVKNGTLSEQLEDQIESVVIEDTTDEEDEVDEENEAPEENSPEKKYKALEKEYMKSQTTITAMRKKIISLEKRLVLKEKVDLLDSSMKEDDDHINEEQILINKSSGHKRDNPQFESKQKRPLEKFTCNQCECVLASKTLLDAHKIEHHNRSIHHCTKCDMNFTNQSKLVVHIKMKHEGANKVQFNCDDCSFQANGQTELNKHLSVTHHKFSSPSESTDDTNYLSCHSCGKKCTTKQDLMIHRKYEHPDIIKKCKFFRNGTCSYENDICWFRHQDLVQAKSMQQIPEFKCRFCENIFKGKSDFMVHRKMNHTQSVPKCRDFQQGNCHLSHEECWYKHDDISFTYEANNGTDSSGFQNAPDNNHPPDMIRRMMDLMEILRGKVDNLEKSAPNH